MIWSQDYKRWRRLCRRCLPRRLPTRLTKRNIENAPHTLTLSLVYPFCIRMKMSLGPVSGFGKGDWNRFPDLEKETGTGFRIWKMSLGPDLENEACPPGFRGDPHFFDIFNVDLMVSQDFE